MSDELKAVVWGLRVKLILGWLALIPIWWVMVDSVGVEDKLTGWRVSELILILPALITAMMLGLTIWYFRVMSTQGRAN